MIKGFRWGCYPGSSGLAQCNHKGPPSGGVGEVGRLVMRSCCDNGNKRSEWFEKWPWAKEWRSIDAEKGNIIDNVI